MTRWGKSEDDRPLTDQEGRQMRREFDAEVARLLRLPPGHRDLFHPPGHNRKLTMREVRYLEWLEEQKELAKEGEEAWAL
jgi:hypothetical protein